MALSKLSRLKDIKMQKENINKTSTQTRNVSYLHKFKKNQCLT